MATRPQTARAKAATISDSSVAPSANSKSRGSSSKPSAQKEKPVKDAIKRFLKKHGFYSFSAAAGPFSVHGVPDIIVCARGRFIGIECKAPGKGNNTTPHQDQHIAAINANGGTAFVATSVLEVEAVFKRLGLV